MNAEQIKVAFRELWTEYDQWCRDNDQITRIEGADVYGFWYWLLTGK